MAQATSTLTADEKWELIRPFYENNGYKVVFKDRPDDSMIEDLYQGMRSMSRMLNAFYEKNPDLERNYLRFKGRVIPS
jgi:hypothetical protein